MIRRITALTLALLTAVTLAQADPLGVWRGAIGPDVIDLEVRVAIAVDEDGSGLTGTIDIPAQGLVGYGLVNVVLEGDALSFTMPDVPGDPTFDGVIDGDRLAGATPSPPPCGRRSRCRPSRTTRKRSRIPAVR